MIAPSFERCDLCGFRLAEETERNKLGVVLASKKLADPALPWVKLCIFCRRIRDRAMRDGPSKPARSEANA